jgi:hypothetical protein
MVWVRFRAIITPHHATRHYYSYHGRKKHLRSRNSEVNNLDFDPIIPVCSHVVVEVRRMKGMEPMKARADSFASLAMSSPEESQGAQDAEESVYDERDRLKAELAHYKAMVAVLQGFLKVQENDDENAASVQRKKAVIVKLPSWQQAAEAASKNAFDYIRGRPLRKEERSTQTNDDRETIEPDADLEMHESAPGLHHRTQKPSGSQMLTKYKTISTDPLDDSISSTESLHKNETDRLVDRKEPPVLETEIEETFFQSVQDRAGWLVGLLLLQSMSSFILARNEALLEEHVVIVRFLTMLVGAGGNAGNQASVRGRFACTDDVGCDRCVCLISYSSRLYSSLCLVLLHSHSRTCRWDGQR